MAKVEKLGGRISDRVRGENGQKKVDADIKFKGNTEQDEDPPSAKAIRNGRGCGLGNGATRARSGGSK